MSLCLIINTIMASFFGVYAWYSSDGKFECYAWDESYAAIENPVGIPQAKDVSYRFRAWFVWGFMVALIGIVYSIFAAIYKLKLKLRILQIANALLIVFLLGNLGWTVCGSVFRYKHYGKVCSGDYFDSELYGEVEPFLW